LIFNTFCRFFTSIKFNINLKTQEKTLFLCSSSPNKPFYFQSKKLTFEKFKQEFGSFKSVEQNLWVYKKGNEYVFQPYYELLIERFYGSSVFFQGSIVENNGTLELRGHFYSHTFFKIFTVLSLLVIFFQVDFIAENLLTLVALLGIVFGFEAYLQYLKKGLIQKINQIFI
jgi:hypothetical protein